METTTRLSDMMPRPVTAGTDWSLQSAKIDQLIAAKSRADVALRNAPKSKANPFFKSDYADLDGITKKVRPTYGAHGLAFCQHPWIKDEQNILVTTLGHESGQWMRSIMPVVALADKNGNITPQAFGSALTYARRYAISSMSNIAATDEDDDAEVAMGRADVVDDDVNNDTAVNDTAVVVDKDAPIAPPAPTVEDELEVTLKEVTTKQHLDGWYRSHQASVSALKNTDAKRFQRVVSIYKELEKKYGK